MSPLYLKFNQITESLNKRSNPIRAKSQVSYKLLAYMRKYKKSINIQMKGVAYSAVNFYSRFQGGSRLWAISWRLGMAKNIRWTVTTKLNDGLKKGKCFPNIGLYIDYILIRQFAYDSQIKWGLSYLIY